MKCEIQAQEEFGQAVQAADKNLRKALELSESAKKALSDACYHNRNAATCCNSGHALEQWPIPHNLTCDCKRPLAQGAIIMACKQCQKKVRCMHCQQMAVAKDQPFDGFNRD